jgi:UDP-glucose 4-epimerase
VSLVLLTGSSGRVGRVTEPALEKAGWTVRRFDLAQGQDLRDYDAVLEATRGCDAIVHAGAIPHDNAGTPADIVATNVLGTWHVLLAAESAAVSRVVFFSSVQVFGFAEGEGEPSYLPADDDHPVQATRPYGMSKRLAEEMCSAWTARTGITTIVLRPVWILTDQGLSSTSPETAEQGAFVHVEDVASAVVLCLTGDVSGHHRLTICGPGRFDASAATTVWGGSLPTGGLIAQYREGPI